jgi:hypothetical protein
MDDVHLTQTTKDPGHPSAVRVLVEMLFLLTQSPRLLVRLLGRIGSHKQGVDVNQGTRLALDAHLNDDISQIPLCIFWNVAHANPPGGLTIHSPMSPKSPQQ